MGLFIVLCLLLTVFSMPALAQTEQKYKLETKQDAIKLIDAASKGDTEAVQKLKSLKAFNKDEVNKLLKDVKLTAADRTKKFDFGDGSSIVIRMELFDNEQIGNEDRELQTGHVTWYFTYEVEVAGVMVAEYLLWQSYQIDGTNDLSQGYSWDSGSGCPPYGVNKYGTSDQKTKGTYVKATGNGGISCFGYEYISVTIIGYCYDDPANENWCQFYTS